MQTIHLFRDVAHHRSFSAAAKLHGITQSAASQRIGQLEKRLGVTLFDRSVRPLALTAPGEVFLEGCEDLLDRYHRLHRRVAGTGDGDGDRGHVRVAAIYSAGIDLLERVRSGFLQKFPGVEIEILYQHPEQVYESVRAQGCDLGIVSYPQRWKQVSVIPLRDEIMAVVTNPKHPLARRDRIQPKDLEDQKLVSFGTDLPVGRHIRRYLREHGVEPVIEHVFDNIDTIKNAVALTDQVAILPMRTVRHEVEMGSLSAVALEPQLVRPLGVIYRPRGPGTPGFSPSARLFIDYLLEHGREPVEQPVQGASA